MGFRHNNLLPNAHFHKDWQRRVKTWFNQAGKKKSRRVARASKAALVAPRPVDGLLRPAVRCPTIKYNTKVRSGRGFTLEELKAAGIRKKEARSIGIAVDFRRRNKSVESLQLNTERLKVYKSKLIVFPKKAGKPQKGDAPAADTANVKQVAVSKVLPIERLYKAEAPRAITSSEKEFSAFAALRKAQSDARLVGVRAKRAKAKAEEEAANAK